MNGIRPHVSDESTLIQALSATHGFPRRETQLAVGLLLKRAGRERRYRLAHGRLFFHRIHRPRAPLNLVGQSPGLTFLEQLHIGSRFQATGALVKVIAAGNPPSSHVGELRFKSPTTLLQLGF